MKISILESALTWFQSHFRQSLVTPIESQFPHWALPEDIQKILLQIERLFATVNGWKQDTVSIPELVERILKVDLEQPPLFKRIMLVYRRHRASETERLVGKTFHLELTNSLEEEVKALDALARDPSFQKLEELRLPRLKDFLPVQFIESATEGQVTLQTRQHDEKFHILQAPTLFLPDVAYFRAKCEERETPLAIAFLDIDDFKAINTRHTETKVDRNLLSRFMQTIEAHLFHHGFAYRQGGDEYLILVPSLSRPLAIDFLDELRSKLADLSYPDIPEKTTVSIGLCVVDADCPLTDRELLDRASRAKKFAKDQGKNRIATFKGSRFLDEELEVATAGVSQTK